MTLPTAAQAEAAPPRELDAFPVRAEAVLSHAFRGVHNFPGKIKKYDGYWMANCFASLSTWDFDQLTRLVIAAHEQCVRVEIKPCNMQYLKIMLHPRKREGGIFERHPDLAQLTERIAQGGKE